jgi:hypothetical protein
MEAEIFRATTCQNLDVPDLIFSIWQEGETFFGPAILLILKGLYAVFLDIVILFHIN